MSRAGFDPGRLRHRVTVESAAGAAEGAGGETVTWDTLATVWAAIEPARVNERIEAGHLSGVVTHVITMRHRDDIAGGMRIVHQGRVFRLLGVDPDERGRFIEARAEETTP